MKLHGSQCHSHEVGGLRSPSGVSISIKLAAFQASGWAEP